MLRGNMRLSLGVYIDLVRSVSGDTGPGQGRCWNSNLYAKC